MMEKFENYFYTDVVDRFLNENDIIYGKNNNSYQEGKGHGLIYGSCYNTEYGGGVGVGFSYGDGDNEYPYPLIQYWK